MSSSWHTAVFEPLTTLVYGGTTPAPVALIMKGTSFSYGARDVPARSTPEASHASDLSNASCSQISRRPGRLALGTECRDGIFWQQSVIGSLETPPSAGCAQLDFKPSEFSNACRCHTPETPGSLPHPDGCRINARPQEFSIRSLGS